MYKKVGSIVVVLTILIVLLSGTILTASAQEGALDPNTPVSNTDGVLAMPEASGALVSSGFKGSGAAEGLAEVAGRGTTAGPVMLQNPSSVIAPDGRVRINPTTAYPNRAIAYLLVTWANGSKGSCTGWFIGPRTVATAGHCVYNTTAGAAKGWAKSIVVYPGRNGASLPYGSTTAYRLFSVTGWTGSTGNPAYDYGAIQTRDAKGTTVGYFGYSWQASNSFPGTYTVRGYPGDKPTATMWTMSGAITNVSATRLWYTIDTAGGQSGSPLYKAGCGTYCGYGIHTYGTSVSPYYGNSSTRITQAVFNNFAAWKARAYP